ncbi:MAG TPA: HAD family hydrolase [Candidatus Methylacidiphilales bacterium]|nr:HAD family hydrolase [Candidatus Methylacidiphilales bacterium]
MSDHNKKTVPLSSTLRLICTDFDGTLAGADGQPIHTVFFERLVGWRKRGQLFWVINTGRTYESLQDELVGRKTPLWPDWIVTLERQIWLVRNQRGIGWFEWNRKCELLHAQLFESVKPIWKLIEDYVARHTGGRLVEDAGSPLGIIASCEEEADEISAFMKPLLQNWPMLVSVRNSIYFRFSHKFYHKGTCLEAISNGLGIPAAQIMTVGDHLNDLPMLERRYAWHLACPGNAVDDVKERVRAEGGYVSVANTGEGIVEAWDKMFPLKKR